MQEAQNMTARRAVASDLVKHSVVERRCDADSRRCARKDRHIMALSTRGPTLPAWLRNQVGLVERLRRAGRRQLDLTRT